MKKLVLSILLMFPLVVFANTFEGIHMLKPHIEVDNTASLQKGAKTFMMYCRMCHSLDYTRYDQIALGIGLVDSKGKIDEKLVQEILNLNGAKLTDHVKAGLTKEQAVQTYGIAPPDLTLETRARGATWVYTYLHSFYKDDTRPSGVNNLLVPNVSMPNILGPMQGQQEPVYIKKHVEVDGVAEDLNVIQRLNLVQPGAMTPVQFDEMTNDLLNFLSYIAEPNQMARYHVGGWVLLFLFIFLIVAYLLKKEFWKDIH